MHKFKVWAPNAKTVAVKVDGGCHSMAKCGEGWWHADVQEAGAGSDYQFILDGGEPLPDPRSGWQPEGVNGPSRLVDHSLFKWTDGSWQARPLPAAVMYELHIGTYTPQGTFQSTIERLDYLADLGVTHVELMPVCEFSGPWGWGYDGVDIFAPHHAYGTPDDLKQLVNACHEKGLAVLLDVVYNHFGPAGNYLPKYGPYLTEAYKTPWGAAVNLDHEGSHEVRRFLIENALMWLRDYHFDGLRLDAVHAFVDHSAFHFLEQLSTEVDLLSSKLGRYFALIAESDLNDPRVVRSREAHGYGITAQWSDDFHHALHSVLTEEQKGYYEDFGSLNQLAKSLREVFVYDGAYSSFRQRMHGRPAMGLKGHHFIGYAQNHDQIGNRAQGERLCHLLSPGRQKIAAAMVFMAPFVPMLFQGEEFCASAPFLYFSQHDEELGRKVSEGRKGEFAAFGWAPEEVPDPQEKETFERSKLDWEEIQEESHASMLAWHKKLIQLRRSSGTLTDGRMDQVEVRFDERLRWFVVKRGDVQVICNLGGDRVAVPIEEAKHVVASEDGWQFRPGLIEIAGDSVAIASHRELLTDSKWTLQEGRSGYSRDGVSGGRSRNLTPAGREKRVVSKGTSA